MYLCAAGAEEEVPLMDVRADVLKKVIEFCRHHTTEGHPIKEIEKVSLKAT